MLPIERRRPIGEGRRFLITRAPLAAAAFAAGLACKPIQSEPEYSEYLLDTPEAGIDLPTRRAQFREVPNFVPLDRAYFKDLLAKTQTESGTPRQRAAAVIANTVGVVGTGGYGTALRIDGSGYYLSVAHVMGDLNAEGKFVPTDTSKFIYDPNSGDLTRVQSFIPDFQNDIAIIYAPTGKGRNRIDSIQLEQSFPSPDTHLWMVAAALNPLTDGRVEGGLVILNGKVNPVGNTSEDYYKTHRRVKGMVPFGGSSGGPIITQTGKVVAFESGFYSDEPITSENQNRRHNYSGSRVAPVSLLTGLMNMQIYRAN